MGLLEALSWIQGLGHKKVQFDMDAKIVVDAIHSTKDNASEFDSIVKQYKYIIHQKSYYSMSFVNRGANAIAHVLARESRSHASPSICFNPLNYIDIFLVNCNAVAQQ